MKDSNLSIDIKEGIPKLTFKYNFYNYDTKDPEGIKAIRRAFKNALNEGITKTFPPDKTAQFLKNSIAKLIPKQLTGALRLRPFPDNEQAIGCIIPFKIFTSNDVNINDNHDFMRFIRSSAEELKKNIMPEIDRIALCCGYRYSGNIDSLNDIEAARYNGYFVLYLHGSFEGLFGNKLENVPNTLYHITTADKAEKIRRQGLVPKSKSNRANYDPRVYAFLKKDLLNFISYAKQAQKKPNSHYKGENQFCIVYIDTSKLSKDVVFYKDNMFENDGENVVAAWTYSNIPPNAIAKIDEIPQKNVKEATFMFDLLGSLM